MFLLLVVFQILHSIEEYEYRLYEVLRPAQAISRFFSNDDATGFLIANILIATAGFTSWVFTARSKSLAPSIIIFWAVLEVLNGAGHILFTFQARGYFPGIYTAPILLVLGGMLLIIVFSGHTEGLREPY